MLLGSGKHAVRLQCSSCPSSARWTSGPRPESLRRTARKEIISFSRSSSRKEISGKKIKYFWRAAESNRRQKEIVRFWASWASWGTCLALENIRFLTKLHDQYRIYTSDITSLLPLLSRCVEANTQSWDLQQRLRLLSHLAHFSIVLGPDLWGEIAFHLPRLPHRGPDVHDESCTNPEDMLTSACRCDQFRDPGCKLWAGHWQGLDAMAGGRLVHALSVMQMLVAGGAAKRWRVERGHGLTYHCIDETHAIEARNLSHCIFFSPELMESTSHHYLVLCCSLFRA
jgi:hypothetical protein